MDALTRFDALKPLNKYHSAPALALLGLLVFTACGFFAFTPHAAFARRLDLPSPSNDGQRGGTLFFADDFAVNLSVDFHQFIGRPIAFSVNVSGLENESIEAEYFFFVYNANYSFNFSLIGDAQVNSSIEMPVEAPAGVYALRVTVASENKTGFAEQEFYLYEGELVVDAVLSKTETPGEYAVLGAVSFAEQRVPFAGVNTTLDGPEQGFFETAADDNGVFEQRFYAFSLGEYKVRI
ncbi:MAG: hypothetical protein QW343_01970, partial [Candidatus Norongarragalinales archaeon]